MSKVDVIVELENFCSKLTEKFGKNSNIEAINHQIFEFDIGRKYARVTTKYVANSGKSAYAFVDMNTGDIYLPASWKAPAKHARGNIFNDISCCGRFGVAYLR